MYAAVTILLMGRIFTQSPGYSAEVHYLGNDENDQVVVCAERDSRCVSDMYNESWEEFEARRYQAETAK